MPKLYLAPAQIRAVLRLIQDTPTRDPNLTTTADQLHEALDAARTQRENRQAEALTAATLRRNKEIEDRNTELYQSWHDIEPVTDLAKATQDTIEALRRATEEPNIHCRNGHNKHLTRCHCDDTQ